MSHPLEGARKRVERAEKHLREVAAELDTFRRFHDDSLTVEYHAATKKLGFKGKAGLLPWGVELPVSDCIHNLRAALDYIIYELARSDSGKTQDGTQFLIEDTAKGFKDKSKGRLRGLSPEHVVAIEGYQPYKGVSWTKTLRGISNPDKHRHLVLVGAESMRDFIIKADTPGTFDGMPGQVFKGIARDGSDVYVERKHDLRITLGDDLPIVETLQMLKDEVSATVDAFFLEIPVTP